MFAKRYAKLTRRLGVETPCTHWSGWQLDGRRRGPQRVVRYAISCQEETSSRNADLMDNR